MTTNRTGLAALTASGLLAAAALTVSPPTTAQQRSDTKTYTFKIDAGPLSRALALYSEVSGIQLVYDSDFVKNLRSDGLSGSYSAQEALDKLLERSSLRARFTSSTTATVVRAEKNGARTLGPVRVEGAEGRTAVSGVNGSRDVTATEGTGSFTTGAMTIGSKAPRSIKDTPQSVSVITHERLEQQNLTDFTRALQQAPGVSFAQGLSSLETLFYSRGYVISSIQIDGGAPLTRRFADQDSVSYFPQIDLAQYDHVEVLRGAAGVFNGYGDPSGTVNLVRKKPLDHYQVTVDAKAGSWDQYRATLDATAPLAFDGRLRGRMVVSWQSNERFYEMAKDKKTLIYGLLDYDLTPTTLITAGVSEGSENSTPWQGGLPRYQTGASLGLPRETSLTFPWNRWKSDTTEIFGSIAQRIGENWSAKLDVTRNEQSSSRKVGYSQGAVNPIDNRGPRLVGQYTDYASEQLSAEVTLNGAVTVFGQRQEVTLGVSRRDQDGGGLTNYAPFIASSTSAPYQPYPGGPRYCYTPSTSGTQCPAGTLAPETPPIDVFGFDPFDPLYTEPGQPLPNQRFSRQGQVQSLAYANFRFTAFDRLHLETGLRWSRNEFEYVWHGLCSSTTTPAACVGQQIGDVASTPVNNVYSGEQFAWPPAVALSYDVTNELVAYLGYADIYQDQSSYLTADLERLGPIKGANAELGLKWSGRDGRLNAALSVYSIERKGFVQQDTSRPFTRPDPFHMCCYLQRQDQTELSEGVDAELTGEVLPGWQVAASYTFSRNEREGSGYSSSQQGQPFLSIQPEHLYKLWTSYDLRTAGVTGWLSNFTVSAGANGQSKGFRAGVACPEDQVGTPDPRTGVAPCLVAQVPYEFSVEPYVVISGSIDYRLNDKWSAALNVENVLDKSYYESVGGVTQGNWYGPPRNFALSVRGTF